MGGTPITILYRFRNITSIVLFILLIINSVIATIVIADTTQKNITNMGFNKGVSYKPVVPTKKVTFVDYNDKSYLDDYSYLAAIPTAIFNDNSKRIFSHPLLLYQDEYQYEEDKERSLNARQGINNFMEDWMNCCYGQLDQMTLINVPKNKIDSSWRSKTIEIIEGNNPYDIASEIALKDWSYSNDVVIAVIEHDFEKPDNFTSSKISGTIPAEKKILEKTFYTHQLDKLNPRFHEFEVPQGYKYLKSRTWWASFSVGKGGESALPLHIKVAIPTADPDSQIYCKYNGDWMQTAVTQGWNIGGMDLEQTESYVYKSGPWRLGITDVPTHGGRFEIFGRLINIIRNMIRGVTYQTDITIFPGVEVDLPVNPPFGCRDATFKLTWNNPSIHLGFSIIGPAGEEILSATNDSDYQKIHLDQLGECNTNESYSVSVFSLDDFTSPIDFKVEFNWHQNFTKKKADSLTSATEGAILASSLNTPLLYISSSKLYDSTKEALNKLGVKNIYLVNLGSHLNSKIKEEIKNIAGIKEHYQDSIQIYKAIMDLTKQNDIVFSTIDPWTIWSVKEMKPDEETVAGLFIGPAAYCAAHHGSPLLIIDNHPELSGAVVWHTEFWKRHADGLHHPSTAQMYLTGNRVYNFLKELGFDKENTETMITVAGQYEIGATWDRTFTGKAKPGRFFGTPVDTSYWISRNVFYPSLIFSNPALDLNGVKLIQGSKSIRRKILPWGRSGLKIIKPSEEELFKFPVLQMYVGHKYRLNEMFNNYYGFQYKSADDIVPGVTESFNPIDEGIVSGKEGAIWPDISVTEVIPSYLEKGGYDSVFSTSFSAITSNLNEGVILLISSTHGTCVDGGLMLTWDPQESVFGYLPGIISNRFGFKKELNPWRGYDWYLGSTENPDTLTMEVHGFIPALLGNPNIRGLLPTGEDFWPSERPILHKLTNLPIIKWFLPKWLKDSDYYKDGMVIAHTIGTLATSSISMNGTNLDDSLDNIHSCGWINTACLPAYKYMHLAMVRHGSSFQVIDPWETSWYGSFWAQSIPRDIILGDTIGEAYVKGISHVGVLYITDPPQWWWDILNNVCFFGDPDLRVYVPDTKFSEDNFWEKKETEPLYYDEDFSVEGHMIFDVTEYPHEKMNIISWQQYVLIFIAIVIIVIGIGFVVLSSKKKKKK